MTDKQADRLFRVWCVVCGVIGGAVLIPGVILLWWFTGRVLRGEV